MLIFQWNKNSNPSKDLGIRKLQTIFSITNKIYRIIQYYTLPYFYILFFLSFLLLIIIFQKSLSIVKYQIIYAV